MFPGCYKIPIGISASGPNSRCHQQNKIRSRATIPLIRPHQCDSDGGRIRGVLLYYHKITEYGIKCCMHAHLEAPRAPPSRGELYRCKTLFLDNFPIFFYPNGTWTHPPTSKLFLDFWNFLNFAKPLRVISTNRVEKYPNSLMGSVNILDIFAFASQAFIKCFITQNWPNL